MGYITMSTTTSSSTRRDSRIVRPGYYRNTTVQTNGLSVRLVIIGDGANNGDTTLDMLGSVVASSVNDILTQPGAKFDYNEAVSRTVTVTHEDSKYSVTVRFQPANPASFTLMAMGRAQTAHVLEHALNDALTGITALTCTQVIDAVMPTMFTAGLSSLLADLGSSPRSRSSQSGPFGSRFGNRDGQVW
jgi:hypothetical protein